MLAKDEILEGRYRIIRQLGHGGMGAVYEAKDERLGSSVALKEIIVEPDRIPNADQQEVLRRAFEREAKLLASLHHEAIPRVTDYFSRKDRQFLIMELIYGDDLGDQLSKRRTPFLPEKTLKWAEQLLDALDYLHTQTPPTFHRDIKPQNLKVTSRGKIKLLDFGIAKSVDTTASTITNQTFVGATLNYAPIEQVLPAIPATFREFIVLKHKEKSKIVLSQNTDARCDIYAVGATLYHLLTNSVPVESSKRSLEVWEGNPDPLTNPSELIPEIPLSISAWLLKAMAIERDDRFASAAEMLETLRSIVLEEKGMNISAERTLALPVDRALTVQDLGRTEAKTERLITSDDSNRQTEGTGTAETLPAATVPAAVPFSVTRSHEKMPPVTGSSSDQFSDTEPPGSDPGSALTGTPYFDEKLLFEKKTSPDIPSAVNRRIEHNPGGRTALFWVKLMILFGFLAAAGAVGLIKLGAFPSRAPAPEDPVSNVVVTPTATPAPFSTQTPMPTVSPITTPAISPTIQPKPSATQNGMRKQKLTGTPKPVNKKKLDDDCLYNGKCR